MGQMKFLLLKKVRNNYGRMLLVILTVKKLKMFYEKESQKANQAEHREKKSMGKRWQNICLVERLI